MNPPTLKNVELKVLATFDNPNVKFFFAKVINQETDFQYVMVAEQGLKRVVLGGRKADVQRFLEGALLGLTEH